MIKSEVKIFLKKCNSIYSILFNFQMILQLWNDGYNAVIELVVAFVLLLLKQSAVILCSSRCKLLLC